MTREALTEVLLKLSDIGNQFHAFNDRFNTFAAKHVWLKLELTITKNCHTFLHQRMI